MEVFWKYALFQLTIIPECNVSQEVIQGRSQICDKFYLRVDPELWKALRWPKLEILGNSCEENPLLVLELQSEIQSFRLMYLVPITPVFFQDWICRLSFCWEVDVTVQPSGRVQRGRGLRVHNPNYRPGLHQVQGQPYTNKIHTLNVIKNLQITTYLP